MPGTCCAEKYGTQCEEYRNEKMDAPAVSKEQMDSPAAEYGKE